jgi:asparagine synthase (glutamine-hydrolysing)
MEGPTALVFGSELKSLLLHPDARREIDPIALSRYLTHECVPAPRTLFRGIRKLPPGHRLLFENGNVRIERWWRLRCAPAVPAPRLEEAEERLESLLAAAVRRRLLSDVPLGAFLSGGIDSSTIAAFMREQASGGVETFSIGFHEASFDESAHARRVAAHLGTTHHEETLSASEMLRLVPRLPEILDEPLGDASILPTYLLSRFTRQRVTVALSGDGGDELFAGYPTYLAHRAASVYGWLPGLLRRGVVGPLARALPVSTRNFSLDFAAKRFVSGEGLSTPERHAVWMGSFAPEAKRRLLSADLRRALSEDDDFESVRALWAECDAPDELSKVLHLDLGLYLQDDVLTKVDRASMACSLEVRNPFLDYTVVEFAAALPPSFKVRGLTTKFLLKQVARKRLPAEIVTRPKKGFGVPMAAWLKGPLRELALETLAPERLRRAGLFDPAEVKRLLDEHLAGTADHRKPLYTLLAFELWREAWIEGRPAAAPRAAVSASRGTA